MSWDNVLKPSAPTYTDVPKNDGVQDNNFLFQDGQEFLFQDGVNFIFGSAFADMYSYVTRVASAVWSNITKPV